MEVIQKTGICLIGLLRFDLGKIDEI
jgi:hypothetical protein